MSWLAVSWVRTLDIPPIPKWVLMTLALRADDDAYCFPSLSLISADTGLGRPAVIRNLAWLDKHDYFHKVHRLRKAGGWSSNGYYLHLGGSTSETPGGSIAEILGVVSLTTHESSSSKETVEPSRSKRERVVIESLKGQIPPELYESIDTHLVFKWAGENNVTLEMGNGQILPESWGLTTRIKRALNTGSRRRPVTVETA